MAELANKGFLAESVVEAYRGDLTQVNAQLRELGNLTQYQIDVLTEATVGPLLLGDYFVLVTL